MELLRVREALSKDLRWMGLLFFILVGCAVPKANPEVAESLSVSTESLEWVELARRPFDGGELIFLGERLPEGLSAWFGVRKLQFVIGNASARTFSPTGTVYRYWRFDLVSPDGDWLVLPQDHYGPYHLVAAAHLDAYLSGGKPDHVLHQRASVENAGAWVHTDARWDGRTLVYKAGLTDMMEFRFELPN